jgi:hypothetical protein
MSKMKKIIVLFFMLLVGYSVHSQVLIALLLGDKLNTGKIEFGLDGGVNYSNIGNMDSNSYSRELNLGFYFDIKMKEQWYLNTGVLVKSTLGVDKLSEQDLEFLDAAIYDAEGDYKQRINYFIVPALARYKFKNNMYAELGPQFGLATKAFIQFDSDVDGNEARIRETNTDMINRFDMGIAGGVGYRLLKGLGWTIGARYYYGFLDVYKDLPGSKNSSLFLKLNIPIGLSLEKKEEVKALKAAKKEKKAKKKEAKKARKEEEKSN